MLIISDIGWPWPAISRNWRPKLINVPSSHEEYPEFQNAKPTSLLVLPFELWKLFLLRTYLTKQSQLSLTTRFYRREITTKMRSQKDLSCSRTSSFIYLLLTMHCIVTTGWYDCALQTGSSLSTGTMSYLFISSHNTQHSIIGTQLTWGDEWKRF